MMTELWHGPRFSGHRRGFRPQIDVIRTDDPPEFRIVVELAGVDPADLHLVVDEASIVVGGERRRTNPEARFSYYQLEIEYGRFERRIVLPEAIDPDGAQATYSHGLLTVRLPVAPAQTRHERVLIEVRQVRD
jgi:HSP20 family protein